MATMFAKMAKGGGGAAGNPLTKGGLAPGGNPMGELNLMSAMKLKKFAAKASHMERNIDEDQWRKNLLDLHRVMKIIHSLYLVLEQNNEALLRVGCEIVTCRQARKCIWWSDNWYDDDEKRDTFKKIVAEKLKIAIGCVTGRGGNSLLTDEEIEALQQKVDALEAKLADADKREKAALSQQRALELQVREMAEQMKEKDDRLEDLEKAASSKSRRMQDGAAQQQISELEAKLRSLEQERDSLKKMQESHELARRNQQEGKNGGEGGQNGNGKMQSMHSMSEEEFEAFQRNASKGELLERRMGEVEKREQMALAQQKALEGQLQNAESRCAERDAKIEELEKALAALTGGDEAGSPQGIRNLQKERDALRAELEALRANCTCNAGKGGRRSTGDDGDLGELCAKQEVEIKALKSERNKLNEERFQMLKTLDQLKEALAKMREVAESRGVSEDVLNGILKGSGVTEVMASKQYSCFTRLYKDAVRRMHPKSEKEAAPAQAPRERQMGRAATMAGTSLANASNGFHPIASASNSGQAWHPMGHLAAHGAGAGGMFNGALPPLAHQQNLSAAYEVPSGGSHSPAAPGVSRSGNSPAVGVSAPSRGPERRHSVTFTLPAQMMVQQNSMAASGQNLQNFINAQQGMQQQGMQQGLQQGLMVQNLSLGANLPGIAPSMGNSMFAASSLPDLHAHAGPLVFGSAIGPQAPVVTDLPGSHAEHLPHNGGGGQGGFKGAVLIGGRRRIAHAGQGVVEGPRAAGPGRMTPNQLSSQGERSETTSTGLPTQGKGMTPSHSEPQFPYLTVETLSPFSSGPAGIGRSAGGEQPSLLPNGMRGRKLADTRR